MTDLFIFSISFWFCLGWLQLSKTLSISSMCPFYWHIVACSFSLMIFCISVVSFATSPFSFITLFESSLLSLMCLIKIYQFFIFSKNNFYFYSDLHDYLFPSKFAFVCSLFSSCFRYKVRLFIWDFYFFSLRLFLYKLIS